MSNSVFLDKNDFLPVDTLVREKIGLDLKSLDLEIKLLTFLQAELNTGVHRTVESVYKRFLLINPNLGDDFKKNTAIKEKIDKKESGVIDNDTRKKIRRFILAGVVSAKARVTKTRESLFALESASSQ